MEIRHATTADARALSALADRDCAAVPAADLLVASVGDRLLAAYAPHSGEVIADPFEPTAAMVAALRAYAAPRTSVRAWLPRVRFSTT